MSRPHWLIIFHSIGTRERHLESLLQQSLRQLILVKNFPRCLIQVVLQITTTPANEYVNTKLVQASSVRSPTYAPKIHMWFMANAP